MERVQKDRRTPQLKSDYSRIAAGVQSYQPATLGKKGPARIPASPGPVNMTPISGSLFVGYGVTGASMVTGSLMSVKAIEMFITMRRLASPRPSANPGRMKSMAMS